MIYMKFDTRFKVNLSRHIQNNNEGAVYNCNQFNPVLDVEIV